MTVETIDTPRRKELRAAREIAKALLPNEDSIDSSLVANAVLVQRIAQARLDTRGAAENAQLALAAAVASMSSLIEAREHSLDSHRHLAELRDARGLRSEDVGCTGGKAARRHAASTALVA